MNWWKEIKFRRLMAARIIRVLDAFKRTGTRINLTKRCLIEDDNSITFCGVYYFRHGPFSMPLMVEIAANWSTLEPLLLQKERQIDDDAVRTAKVVQDTINSTLAKAEPNCGLLIPVDNP